MNEAGGKRREWVKTVAIIFLSVLLVLTFFSNTIMNYSLPEVATQYVEPGTITAKIRGSATVESADPYSVKLKTTDNINATGVYEVESIEVKRGDMVEKGDVLCVLASVKNTMAEDKQEEIDMLVAQYERDVLGERVPKSVLDNVLAGKVFTMDQYMQRMESMQAEIVRLEESVKEAEDTLEAWKKQQDKTVNPTKEKQKLEEAQAAYDEVKKLIDDAKEQIGKWQEEIDSNNKLIADYEDGKVVVNQEGSQVPAVSEAEYEAAKANNEILQGRIDQKKAEIADAEAKLPELEAALKKAQKNYNSKIDEAQDTADDSVAAWTKEVENRKEILDEAIAKKSSLEVEHEWSKKLSGLREELSDLQTESVGGEVVAPISGEIIAVNVKSGEDTPDDGVLFAIQPVGKGYTMEFTVTNEQAKRVSVGNVAELVNAWRYDDVQVILTGIKPSPQNPAQNKLLTFDVTGSVTDGQSLSVALGEKSLEYELTVPNSAIREDNNGKFILIVETKSTPLSNRYIATRVDVEVLASDDTRSAISAPLYGYDYVITTATAPVEAGKQVRLANN